VIGVPTPLLQALEAIEAARREGLTLESYADAHGQELD
jgi:hypothetical protein